MWDERDIRLRLSEYRAKATGKDPFGPWTDLNDFYAQLPTEEERAILLAVLKEKQADSFWKDFIKLFLDEKGLKL